MLPWIIGGAVVAAVGYALNDSEEKSIKKKRKKLKKRADTYALMIEAKEQRHRDKKQSMLFSQIKSEQSRLKKERRQLAQVRNTLQRGTPMHCQVVKQMKQLQQQIDQKQRDADRVRL